jgi:uncharacterized membrane protein YcaP (DUF421 family)
MDWSQVFQPETPVLEIVARGTVVYLALFVLLRLVLKRESGSLGMTDVLVVVLLADAAQNAMAGEYRTVPDGLLLCATIIFWALALEWLAYRVPMLRRFIRPEPLPLVRDGRVLRRNLRKELITEEELMAQVRRQGLSDLSEVDEAHMETDGRLSVVPRERARGGHEPG